MSPLLVALTLVVAANDQPPNQAEIRSAVVKALPLLQKGSAGHMANRSCFACHNQGPPVLAMVIAQARGLAIDEPLLKTNLDFTHKFLESNRAGYLKGKGQGGQVATAGTALWTLELGGRQSDETSAAVTDYLVKTQQEFRHWLATSNRPPTEGSPFTTSFVALRALHTFGTPEQQERIAARTRLVRQWLLKTPAKETEDRVFRLWALKEAGAHPVEVEAAARELLRQQRPGGGWAQLDSFEPDAYATGSALVALHEATGRRTSEPFYQQGIRFLLKTQLDDGSWHIVSRSRPFQTYFETGFPHGKDQFISSAASGWATAALALACEARIR